MKHRPKDERKAYGMRRMMQAIGRAIRSESSSEKDRAARWASAWGVVSGIHTPGIRLRRSALYDPRSGTRHKRTA